MSPEMIRNEPHGKSIDWYGVGVLLYELVVGIPPYYNAK
jgi:serine/threonine protein kinase